MSIEEESNIEVTLKIRAVNAEYIDPYNISSYRYDDQYDIMFFEFHFKHGSLDVMYHYYYNENVTIKQWKQLRNGLNVTLDFTGDQTEKMIITSDGKNVNFRTGTTRTTDSGFSSVEIPLINCITIFGEIIAVIEDINSLKLELSC